MSNTKEIISNPTIKSKLKGTLLIGTNVKTKGLVFKDRGNIIYVRINLKVSLYRGGMYSLRKNKESKDSTLLLKVKYYYYYLLKKFIYFRDYNFKYKIQPSRILRKNPPAISCITLNFGEDLFPRCKKLDIV